MLRSAFAAVYRFGVMAVIVFLATAALGWMYWLALPTSHWPGPKVIDVLPLDELAGHENASLILFAVTMVVAGLLAGRVARIFGYDGYAIALVVGAGIGGWLYVSSAISIFVVRQVPIDAAFDATRGTHSMYLAAVLFAVAVAASAHRVSREGWLTRLVPGVVALFGIVDICVATLPHSPGHRVPLGGLLTGSVEPWARTLEVGTGVVILLCARGLGRRSRHALGLAAVFVVVSLIVRSIDVFNVSAVIVGALVLVTLVAGRDDFSYRGDPTMRSSALVRFVGTAGGTVLYGVAALTINRVAAGLPVHFMRAVQYSLYSLVIGAPPQSGEISAGFGQWFPWSLRAIALLGIAWGASTWFAPWRHRPVDAIGSRRHAKRLVDAWGSDSLAPFSLRGDKAHYFYPDAPGTGGTATTLISYRVVRGVAIVSGDPVGPTEQAASAIAAFRELCAERGWRFALLGASDRLLEQYCKVGLRPIYHGEEAVIETADFSLSGGERKSVRQAVNRVERKGYVAAIKTAAELSEPERIALATLEDAALQGAARKGFVMELDELFRLDGDDGIYVIGRDPDGGVVGFLEVAVCAPSASLSLSAMPRSADAPNGLNAFLIAALVEWAREHSYGAISLNFSPGAKFLANDGPATVGRRVGAVALRVAKRLLGLQLDNLLRFNRSFGPRWQARYVIIDRRRDLPRVIVAAMAAERYLPFAEFFRGREWQQPIAEAPVVARVDVTV